MSRVSDRDRALADGRRQPNDDGYSRSRRARRVAAAEHDVLPEEFAAALKLVQSFDPPGVAARTLDECLRIQLENLPETPDARLRYVEPPEPLPTAKRGCSTRPAAERELHIARALIRSLDLRSTAPRTEARHDPGCRAEATRPLRSSTRRRCRGCA
jgi:RNA polymerase sigma-54 factor